MNDIFINKNTFMKKNLFTISEEEKSRILEMHVNATKNLYLNEQLQNPTQGNVTKPQYKYTEVSGSASAVPIVNSSVLANLGVPATPENFKNTFFYTDRNGLSKSFAEKNMSDFNKTTTRTTESLDNIVARYKDGSEIRLEGEGTKEFPTKGLVAIGGAGNGLLALSRAIKSGTGYLPSVIKATLSGSMEGGSYTYNSAKVNDVASIFNGLLAHFLKPYVTDVSKISPSFPFRNYFIGTPDVSSSGLLNALTRTYLPKGENVDSYGITNETPEIQNALKSAKPNMTADEVQSEWQKFVNLVITNYKENLTKFLVQKFGEDRANQYLTTFKPTIGMSAKEMLSKMGSQYGPGFSKPVGQPQQSKTSQTFKSGQG